MKPVVVLISPKGAANVGGVARLMGNFGLQELRIIQSRCDLESRDCKERALKAYSLIEKAKHYDSFEAGIADLSYVVGYSMQPQEVSVPSCSVDELEQYPPTPWAVCFGREDNGMEAAELLRCNKVVWIPTVESFPSINLTSSAAIALSRWYSASQSPSVKYRGQFVPAPKKDEEIFFESLKSLLQEIEFMKTSSDHILDDLRNIYRRADISDRDLRILFGVLSDIGRRMEKRFTP